MIYKNNNENDDITIEDHENIEIEKNVENDNNYNDHDEMNQNEISEETHPELVGVHNNNIENPTEVKENDGNNIENNDVNKPENDENEENVGNDNNYDDHDEMNPNKTLEETHPDLVVVHNNNI